MASPPCRSIAVTSFSMRSTSPASRLRSPRRRMRFGAQLRIGLLQLEEAAIVVHRLAGVGIELGVLC